MSLLAARFIRYKSIRSKCIVSIQGRLNELMSQMRMQNQLGSASRPEAGCQIDPAVQQELKKVSEDITRFNSCTLFVSFSRGRCKLDYLR